MSSSEKQRDLAKKRLTKRLKKKRSDTAKLPRNAVVVNAPAGAEKMSEVIEEFVEPYLNMAQTEDSLGKLLTLAISAWNAALLPPAKREKFLQELGQTLPMEQRDDFRTVLDPLIQRKLEHLPRIAG